MQVWTIACGSEAPARHGSERRAERGDRLRKALEAIDNGHQDIGNAPVLEFVHHPEPEPRPAPGQALAPSVCSIQMPGISLPPLGNMPSAI